MWRPVLSAVFVATGLIWLFAGMLRGPVVPSAGPPATAAAALQEVHVATSFPTTAEPIAIVLPERSPPESKCGRVAGAALSEEQPIGDLAAPDCALAALLEQAPASASPLQSPLVVAAGNDGGSAPTPAISLGQQQNPKRTAWHRPARRPVAVARSSVVDRPEPGQPSVTWRFPSDPSVGGAG